jgi:hypothetical protein
MTNLFFDSPHLFVVFHPGSSGNFLVGLLDKMIQGDMSDVPLISKNGSSHTVNNFYMSFGRTADEQLFYKTREDKEHFYLTQINDHYSNVDRSLVSWSHDFSNIEFYKKYFKNSKIICITTDTIQEILSCTFMNVTKMMLDNPANWPVSDNVRQFRTQRLERACKIILYEILKPQHYSQINEIYQLRYSTHYKPLIEFVYMRLLLYNFGILNTVENNNQKEHNVFNYVICPSSDIQSKSYTIGEHIRTYTQLANYCLPYNSIIGLNYQLVIEMISTIIDRKVTDKESKFIHIALDNYVSAQNNQLITDPIFYYNRIKQQISEFIIGTV